MSLMEVGTKYTTDYTHERKRGGILTATCVYSDDEVFRMKYEYEHHPKYDALDNHGVNYLRIFEDKWDLVRTVKLPEDLFTL